MVICFENLGLPAFLPFPGSIMRTLRRNQPKLDWYWKANPLSLEKDVCFSFSFFLFLYYVSLFLFFFFVSFFVSFLFLFCCFFLCFCFTFQQCCSPTWISSGWVTWETMVPLHRRMNNIIITTDMVFVSNCSCPDVARRMMR